MSTPKQRRRRGRFSPTAIGFLSAFALSVATIIYTGLKVGAPRDSAQAPSTTLDVTPADAAITAGAAGEDDAGARDATPDATPERPAEPSAADAPQ